MKASKFAKFIIEKAKSNPKRIILPEMHDPRIKEAVRIIRKKGIAEIPHIVCNNVNDAVSLLKEEAIDGVVAGATTPTRDTLISAIKILKTKKGVKTASSFFIMLVDEEIYFFADCAFNVKPTPSQLAEIAISTADSAKLLGFKPRIAMLSFSTKGSANHEEARNVAKATTLVKNKRPDLEIEGEVQVDAALIPRIAELKKADMHGKANILIFPDLNSGNIAYKLVERMAGAKAIGPVLQGFNGCVNDLSRGCSVDDIVLLTALTVVQAQNK